MKKIMAMMIGLGLMLGTVSMFGAEGEKKDEKQQEKKGKKKGGKKKDAEKKDPAR